MVKFNLSLKGLAFQHCCLTVINIYAVYRFFTCFIANVLSQSFWHFSSYRKPLYSGHIKKHFQELTNNPLASIISVIRVQPFCFVVYGTVIMIPKFWLQLIPTVKSQFSKLCYGKKWNSANIQWFKLLQNTKHIKVASAVFKCSHMFHVCIVLYTKEASVLHEYPPTLLFPLE